MIAVVKAQAVEAEACWVVEEKVTAAAAARCRDILAVAETVAEEAGMEQGSRSVRGQPSGSLISA